MEFCHRHNLVDPDAAECDRNFGIRVTLPPADTIRSVLGDGWEKFHWFATESERDRAYDQMAKRHGYYRASDTPTLVLDKVTR